MIALEAREDELSALLSNQPPAEPALHPNLTEIYRAKVADLHLWLIPEDGQLRVELRGALAGILALSTNAKTHLRGGADGSVSVLLSQIKLVAGARNQLVAKGHS